MTEITTAGLFWLAMTNAASWMGIIAVSWVGFRMLQRLIRQNETLTEQVVTLKAHAGWTSGLAQTQMTDQGTPYEYLRATAGEPPDDHEEPI